MGVLGNLAANLDWRLLAEAVDERPIFHWAFVGPTKMKIAEASQRKLASVCCCSMAGG